jgi:phytoene dehydrogenase-like protein
MVGQAEPSEAGHRRPVNVPAGFRRRRFDQATQPPARPFLLLGQMTTAAPSRSPAGTDSCWAYTHVPRGHRWDHDDEVRRYADRIEQVVERHAPGFTSLIRGRHVSSPEDLRRRDLGLVGGAINAGTLAIHQQLLFRPVPGLGRADTPIDRLFLAGASATPVVPCTAVPVRTLPARRWPGPASEEPYTAGPLVPCTT